MTRPFGITIMVFLPTEIRVKKPIVFNANIPNENVACIVYYNSEFPMFLFVGTEQKQYIFQDDLRNDR